MTTDLARRHGPITNLFAQPESRADWDGFRLSDEQVQLYQEHGYVAGVRVLTDEQVEALRGELAAWSQPGHPGEDYWYEYHTNESDDPATVLFHALGAWRIGAAFHDLLWNPAFTVPASQLLEGPVRFWHDQLFCKPARHGGVVAWHQDYSYWTRTVPMRHITCWIALDDSTRENGCLQYIPGSHQWPLLPMPKIAGKVDAIRALLNAEQWEQFQHPVAIELPKGHAAFHHPLLLHGSYANQTDRPRRAAVVNAFRDGTRSDTDETLLTGVPPIPVGQAMGGMFFPMLLDPARIAGRT